MVYTRGAILIGLAVLGGGCATDPLIPAVFDLDPNEGTLMAPAGTRCETLVPMARAVRGGPDAFTINRSGGVIDTVPCVANDAALTCEAQTDAGARLIWTITLLSDQPGVHVAHVVLDYQGSSDACVGSMYDNVLEY